MALTAIIIISLLNIIACVWLTRLTRRQLRLAKERQTVRDTMVTLQLRDLVALAALRVEADHAKQPRTKGTA